MRTLNTRIKRLVSSTSSQEVKSLVESVVAMRQATDLDKSRILIDGLKSIDEKAAKDFVVSETTILTINDLGIRESLEVILNDTNMKTNPQAHYNFKILEGAVLRGTPDFELLEHFGQLANTFRHIKSVSDSLSKIQESYNKNKLNIDIAKTVAVLERRNDSFLYQKGLDALQEFLFDKSTSKRSNVLETLKNFQFNSEIKNITNLIKNTDKNGFNVISNNSQCIVENIYSPFKFNGSKHTFFAGNKFMIKDGESLRECTQEEVQSLDDNYKIACLNLASSSYKVHEGKISFYTSNHTLSINVNENDGNITKEIQIGDRKFESWDTAAHFINHTGVIAYGNQEQLNIFHTIYEMAENVLDVSFGKTISYGRDKSYGVELYKIGDKVFMNKRNPHMNENLYMGNVSVTEAHQSIMNFLAFDISESLYEFLDEERKAQAKLNEKKKGMLEAIDALTAKLTKLESTQAIDPKLKENEDINKLKKGILERIEKIKDSYNNIDVSSVSMSESIVPGDTVTVSGGEGSYKVDSISASGANLSKEGSDEIITVDLSTLTKVDDISVGSDVPPINVDPSTGENTQATNESLTPGDTVTVTGYEGSYKIDSFSTAGVNLSKEGSDEIISVNISDLTKVDDISVGADVPPINIDPATGEDAQATNEGLSAGDKVTVVGIDDQCQIQSIDNDAGYVIVMDSSGSTHNVSIQDIELVDALADGDSLDIVAEGEKYVISATVKKGKFKGKEGMINPQDFTTLGDDDDIEMLIDGKKIKVQKGDISADLSESNISILLKLLNEKKVNEGSYDTFLNNYASEIKSAINDLKLLHKNISKLPEDRYEKVLTFMDDKLSKIYDKENVRFVMGALDSEKFNMNVREVADVAVDISNNHGTEMQMVLQCMDDATNFFYQSRKIS